MPNRGVAPQPPNYRSSDSDKRRCGTCRMYDRGLCWGFGNKHVDAHYVCDNWAAEKQEAITLSVSPTLELRDLCCCAACIAHRNVR